MFVVVFLLGYFWLDAVIIFLAIFLANIPNILLSSIAICLSLVHSKISKYAEAVKGLKTAKMVGSTSVLCVDKTGTLTEGHMKVSHVWTNQTLLDADTYKKDSVDTSLRKVAVLSCANQGKERNQMHSPVDAAVMTFFQEEDKVKVQSMMENHEMVYELPFNSFKKYQARIAKVAGGEKGYYLVIKGAPEVILRKCTTILVNGIEQKLEQPTRNSIINTVTLLGSNAEYVIGFSYLKLSESLYDENHLFDEDTIPLEGLRFVGLMSMNNPVRKGAQELVSKCQGAGIRILMLTGDHTEVAKAVAKSTDILPKETVFQDYLVRDKEQENFLHKEKHAVCVIQGQDVSEFSSQQLDNLLRQTRNVLFTRMSPNHKAQVVESCKRVYFGAVAYVGDEVNDIPALEKADTRILVKSSTCLPCNTVENLAISDDLSSICQSIQDSRLLVDNIKKCILYIVSFTLPTIGPFIFYILLDIPLPLGAFAILMLDLLALSSVPGIAMMSEEPEYELMKPQQFSDNKCLASETLISRAYGQLGIIQLVTGMFAYFVVMAENGFWPGKLIGIRSEWDNDHQAVVDIEDSYGQEWTYQQRKLLEITAQTAYFVALVLIQVASVLVCRTRIKSVFSVRWSHTLTATIVCLLLAIVFTAVVVPFLVPAALGLTSLKVEWWFLSLPFLLLMVASEELRKWGIRRNPEGFLATETLY
eukprot:TRINITY_DN7739_c0_g1_i2.p1 TRINITY_DN7739_c0_g1~~TRINITY_DN7739_c0_g1_i2.p1  ORF type:complete len:701 (+),score=92.52 TRINITY_DN7739_c0_g1_i2:174-2276(+)